MSVASITRIRAMKSVTPLHHRAANRHLPTIVWYPLISFASLFIERRSSRLCSVSSLVCICTLCAHRFMVCGALRVVVMW